MSEEVAKAIILLKGVYQKKHTMAHEKGHLRLISKPLAYKGSVEAFCSRLKKVDDKALKQPEPNEAIAQKIPLEKIKCPECDSTLNITKMKLHVKTGHSSLTCQNCREVNLSSRWRCPCNKIWFTCSTHVHAMKKKQGDSISRPLRGLKRKGYDRGVDRPFPVKRIHLNSAAIDCTPIKPRGGTRLPPGSILARRFPHLVEPG